MKATLTFTLPDDEAEFQAAVDGPKYRTALWEISQRVFRPARKHGYPSTRIQSLLDATDSVKVPSMDGYTENEVGGGTELVSALEKLFYEILQEEGIEL
jgi:hypothetical protein